MKRKNILGKIKRLINYPFSYNTYEHRPDYILIIALGLICFFGLLMLSSASSVQAFQKFNDSYYFLKHQLLRGFLPGLIIFFIVSRIDFRRWRKYAFYLLVATVVMLILVFIPGLGTSYGKAAQSWIKLGFLSFQPAEIVKLTFLIYLATWLAKRNEKRLVILNTAFYHFCFSWRLLFF